MRVEGEMEDGGMRMEDPRGKYISPMAGLPARPAVALRPSESPSASIEMRVLWGKKSTSIKASTSTPIEASNSIETSTSISVALGPSGELTPVQGLDALRLAEVQAPAPQGGMASASADPIREEGLGGW